MTDEEGQPTPAQLEQRIAQLEEQLRTAEAARDEAFGARDQAISMLAHELRSPLQTLTVGVELVLTRLRQSADVVPAEWLVERTERTKRAVDRLRFLTDAMLGVAQLRAGHVELLLEPVDLSQVAHDVLVHLRDELAWAGCATSLDAPTPVVGSWDRRQLDLILTNLVSNALKYGAGQPVTVTVSGRDGQACVSVRDGGPGIAPADRERLFQPFVRLKQGSETSGLGLGLWIVRQLAHALGGRVELQSAPGQGACFTVILPLATPRAP